MPELHTLKFLERLAALLDDAARRSQFVSGGRGTRIFETPGGSAGDVPLKFIAKTLCKELPEGPGGSGR